MTTTGGPFAEPSDLANRLRTIRVNAGISGKELAEVLGWQPSKVSRLETGKQMPSADDLKAWVRASGADEEVEVQLNELLTEAQTVHLNWKRRLQRGHAAVQASYQSLEEESRVIRHFEMTYVPGLLQTPEYARSVLQLSFDILGSGVPDLDAAVTTRLQRQQALYAPDKQFEFLLAEPALRWLFCPREVVLGQLDRLQTAIGMPRVRFGILPMNMPIATAPRSSFQLYDETGVSETFAGEIIYRGAEAETLASIFDTLWRNALTGEDARRKILAVADEIRSS